MSLYSVPGQNFISILSSTHGQGDFFIWPDRDGHSAVEQFTGKNWKKWAVPCSTRIFSSTVLGSQMVPTLQPMKQKSSHKPQQPWLVQVWYELMPRGEPLDIAFIDIDPIAREGDIPARAPAPRSRGWWRCLQGWRWLRCRRWVRASDWTFGFLGLFGWFHEDGEFWDITSIGKMYEKVI